MKKFLLHTILLTVLVNTSLNAQDVIQLTDNSFADIQPQLSGNNLVWIGQEADFSSDIYFADLLVQSDPVALTSDGLFKDHLRISGPNLVWEAASSVDDFNTYEIHGLNLDDTNPPFQLTDNDISDRKPQISGDNTVWFGRDHYGSSNDSRIYHFDLSLVDQEEPTKLLDDGNWYYWPVISGNHVAWYYGDGSDSEIMYYNLDQQDDPVQLTSTSAFVSELQFSHSKLWWKGWHGNIQYLDLNQPSSPVEIYDVDPNGYSLYLDGADNYAVWSRWDGDQRDLFYYNLNGGGNPVQLTNDSISDYNPVISGGYILWQRGEGDATEIFYYDLINDGPITQLTENDFHDGEPIALGSTFVWEGGYIDQKETYEIFTTELPMLSTSSRELPVQSFQLGDVMPNPASEVAVIPFHLTKSTNVNLQILDLNGRTLNTLVDQIMPTGTHQIEVDVNDLPSGIYYYSLRADHSVMTKRLVVNN